MAWLIQRSEQHKEQHENEEISANNNGFAMMCLSGTGNGTLLSPHLAWCALGVASLSLSGNAPAFAQVAAIPCLAPEVPMTALPDAVLAEYRPEIAAEFEAYFSDVSAYIACLDAERARVLSEARVATDDYSTLLTTLPPRKDLP